MREIKFRAKDLETDKWVYGYLFKIWEEAYILWGTTNGIPNMTKVAPNTVCQYSGLKDIEGTEVYDADILEGKESGDYGVVSFTAPQFTVEGVVDKQICTLGDGRVNIEKLDFSKVAGNIYENPELLTPTI